MSGRRRCIEGKGRSFEEVFDDEMGKLGAGEGAASQGAEGRATDDGTIKTVEDLAGAMNLGALAAGGFDTSGTRVFLEERPAVSTEFSAGALSPEGIAIVENYAWAQSDLFIGDEWSQGVIHGPDMMLAVTPVVETMLEGSDRLDRILKVRFRRPLRGNMLIFATKDDRNTIPYVNEADKENMVIRGSFLTQERDVIHFVGFAHGEDPVRQQPSNPVPHRLTLDQTYEHTGEDGGLALNLHQLSDLDSDEDMADGNANGFSLNTVMDTVLLASSLFNDAPRTPKGNIVLAAGFNKLVLPPVEALRALQEIRIWPDFARIVTTPKGVQLLKFRFEIVNKTSVCVSSGEYVKGFLDPEKVWA